MSDLINKFIADGAEQELIDVNLLMKELVSTLKTVHAENKGIELKVSGGAGIKELVDLMKEQDRMKKSVSDLSLAMDQYNKLLTSTAISEAKLAAADSDAAKTAMAAKVALEEKNKELKKSAQLENEAFLARQKSEGITPAQTRSLEIAERNELLAIEKELARIAKQDAANQRSLEIAERNEILAIEKELARIKKEEAASAITPAQQRSLEIAERNEILAIEKELARIAKEEAAAKAANFASSAQFQAEAKALYDIVKAHNEAAAALRAEAAEKTKLALQSTDAAERTRLEAAATDALTNAQKEERSVKEALANANKQVAATVRDNVLAENALIAAKTQLEARMAAEIAAAARQENAYEKLKREYNDAAYAVKTLAAEYVILQRSGTASVDELERLRKELQLQQEATLQQSNALLQMEQAVGQNQRAVGNYANATGEINQILREMPNFAISAQTGILSLSNNLPMLQASLSRLAQTVDVNTGAAIGWRGVLRTVGTSLFSLQGLIVLLTTLMVAYGKDILNAINPTTALQRATEAYNKSLETQIETISKEVGSLKTLQYALNDTTRSTDERKVALDRLNAAYPGYFSNLSAEVADIINVNAQIEKQIELLTAQAKAKASEEAVGGATEELLKAQQKLNKESGFLEEIWSNAKWLSGYKASFSDASESTKKLILEQENLYKQGLINRNEYQAMYFRLLEVDKAQKGFSETLRQANDPVYRQTKAIEDKIQSHLKEIQVLQDEINKEKESIRVYGEGVNHTKDYIANKEKQIDVLNRSISAMSGEIAEMQRRSDFMARLNTLQMKTVSAEEIAVMRAENNANRVKKGTKEREVLDRKVLDAQFEVNKKKLQNEYRTQKGLEAMRIDDLEKNQEYIIRLENMRSELYDKTDNKKDKAVKKEAKIFDPTKEILAANQREFTANQEFDKSQLEATNAHLENIVNVETNSLQKRLNAYEQYVENLKAISEIDYNTSITEKQKQLDAVLAIEKKYSVELTKENLAEFSKRKELSGDERSLVLQKFALMQELSVASAKQAEATLKINEKAQKEERTIIENSIKYQVQQDNARYNALRAAVDKEVALRLEGLNKQRENGEVGERQFWSMRQFILASESQILFDKEMEFLKMRKEKVIAELTDPAIPEAQRKSLQAQVENINKLFGDLEKVRPEPKKVEKKSILEYMGFPSMSQSEAAAFDESIEGFRRTQDAANAMIYQASKDRDDAQTAAGALYAKGSDEYNALLISAAQAEAEAIKKAEAIKAGAAASQDAAMKAREQAEAQRIEAAKKQIAGLIVSLSASLGDVYASISAAQTEKLDRESEAIQRKLEEELAANESSLKSQEEKAQEEKRLRAAALANEKRLANERRKIEREEAVRRRRLAIFEAGVNAGLAASKALKDYPFPYSAVVAGLVGALALAQIAAISAQPLPAYWQGTDNHPGGLALVSEKGQEMGILPSGERFLTPSTPTIMDLPRGTEIIPNHELAKIADTAAMKEMRVMQSASVQNGANGLTPEQLQAAFNLSADKIVGAIKNKPEFGMTLKNGEWVKTMKLGNTWTSYLGRSI